MSIFKRLDHAAFWYILVDTALHRSIGAFVAGILSELVCECRKIFAALRTVKDLLGLLPFCCRIEFGVL